MERFTVNHQGCQLACKKTGSGPLMLMIHGVAADSSYYEKAAKMLASDYTIITYDRRGYTESCCTEEGELHHSITDQADDARAILEAVNAGPAIVVGTSAGGIISMELKRKYPEWVSQLITYEAACAITTAEQDSMDDWIMDLLTAYDGRRLIKTLLLFVKALGGLDPDGAKKDMEQQNTNLRNFKVFLDSEITNLLTYGKQVDRRVIATLPDVMGVGAYDPEGRFAQMTRAFAEHAPAPLDVLAGYHNLPEDQPEVFAAWIRQRAKS